MKSPTMRTTLPSRLFSGRPGSGRAALVGPRRHRQAGVPSCFLKTRAGDEGYGEMTRWLSTREIPRAAAAAALAAFASCSECT
jgi:hypothetical protein